MIPVVDRDAIEHLWDFTEYSWTAYEDAIRPAGDALLTEPAPGSGWPSLSDALRHMCWAYVRWLDAPGRTTDRPVEEAPTWDRLNDYRRRVRGHARAYLDSLNDAELTAIGEIAVDGEPRRYSPAEVFATVLLHERQHHGDLNTLLYQLGRDIPLVEYRFSLRGRGT